MSKSKSRFGRSGRVNSSSRGVKTSRVYNQGMQGTSRKNGSSFRSEMSGSPRLNKSREERKKRIKRTLNAIYKKKPKMRRTSPHPSPRPYRWSPNKVKRQILSSRDRSIGGRRRVKNTSQRKSRKKLHPTSRSPLKVEERIESSCSSKSNISNHLHNRVMRTFKNMKKSSNVPLNIKLEVFFDLDSIFWEILQPITEEYFKDISSNILKDYVVVASNLKEAHCLFRTNKVKWMVQKAVLFEQYFLCFYLKFIQNEYLRQTFNIKGILRYLFKNFIILLDMILEKGFTIYKSQNNFLKLKRLVSKRKSFFEIPSRMEQSERLKEINRNFKFVKTLLISEFEEYPMIVEEIRGFLKEIDLISKGESRAERIGSYFKLILIQFKIDPEGDSREFQGGISLIPVEKLEKGKNLFSNLESKIKEKEDERINKSMRCEEIPVMANGSAKKKKKASNCYSVERKKSRGRLKKVRRKSPVVTPRTNLRRKSSKSKSRSSYRSSRKNLTFKKVAHNRSPKPNRSGGGFLPPNADPSYPYTLVLDLDETLIHFKETEKDGAKFLIRPNTRLFLSELAKHYEIIIFTAATKEYADWVLDRLDKDNLIKYRLYRKHTSKTRDDKTVKDLKILGRDLSKVIIVDNIADNFRLQPDNGIVIKSWTGDSRDKALKQLLPLLIRISTDKSDDVRSALQFYREKLIELIKKGVKEPHLKLFDQV